MRACILLTIAATLTGCSHMQRCGQVCRKVLPGPTCKVRQPATCCDADPCRSSSKWSCPDPCRSSKKLGLGWKEVKVPCLKVKDRCHPSASCNDPCRTPNTCREKPACCNREVAGCCVDGDSVETTPTFRVGPNEAVPVPVLPQQSAQMQNFRSQQQVQQWNQESRIPATAGLDTFAPMMTAPVNNHFQNQNQMPTGDLARRTQALEARVNELQNLLQKRHAINQPADNGVIMLPKPQWQTMDGVPPIPNSSIEQTSGHRYGGAQWGTARAPQMWPHSPQNIQRSMLR